MTALFIIAGLIWAVAFVYALPGALAAFGKRPRIGDAMRVGVAATSLMVMFGAARYLFAPDSQSLIAALFVYVIGVGCFVLWLMRIYGRGRYVD